MATKNTLKVMAIEERKSIEVKNGIIEIVRKSEDIFSPIMITETQELTTEAYDLIEKYKNQDYSLSYVMRIIARIKNALADTLTAETEEQTTTEPAPAPVPEVTTEPAPTVEVKPAPAPAPAPVPSVTAPAVNFGLDALIGNAVKTAIEANTNTITTEVQNYLDLHGIRPTTKSLIVTNPEGVTTEVGQTHKDFEDVLCAVQIRRPALLIGTPGIGKSYMCKQIAKSLNLSYAEQSFSAGTYTEEFFGFVDAHGKPVKTLFESLYANGGVFLLDELDNGNPNTTAALNNAISSDEAKFASGMVKKHKDFTFIATANTYGTGATAEFAGRNPIDSATLDRFLFFTITVDEELENTFTNNRKWAETVRNYRTEANNKKIRTFITPRATIMGSELLAVGMKPERVIEVTIFKGMNQDERNLLKNVVTPILDK